MRWENEKGLEKGNAVKSNLEIIGVPLTASKIEVFALSALVVKIPSFDGSPASSDLLWQGTNVCTRGKINFIISVLEIEEKLL